MTKSQLDSLFVQSSLHGYKNLVVAHALLWIQSQQCEQQQGISILNNAAKHILDQLIGDHNEQHIR